MIDWERFSVYKKNKTPPQLTELQMLPHIHTAQLSVEKNFLKQNLIPYLEKEEDRQFYRKLCFDRGNEGNCIDSD